MNYFERLIRRALLEAPSRPGEALRDPFENEAPLQLETPVQRPSTSSPPRAAVTPESAPIEKRIEVNARTLTTHETVVTATPAMPMVPIESKVASRVQPETSIEVRVNPPTAPAPLAQADAFMRSLGLPTPEGTKVQPRTDAQESHVSPLPQTQRVTAPVEVRVERELPPPATKPQPMQPPMEATAAVRDKPEASRNHPAIPSPAENSSSTRPRGKEPAPQQVIVREKVHVVKVVDTQTSNGSLVGAAPPTFGAAQL